MGKTDIRWLSPGDLGALTPGLREDCALVADLRDPLMLPLLRPAPHALDFKDETRPGASDRAYFLARRAALRSLVGLCASCPGEDVRIGYDGPGAPRVLVPDGVDVSVSGRGALAALAVSSQPVGVDMEVLHKDVEIIRSVLHPQERGQLADMYDAEKQRQFLRIWTAKEAFLKALGLGLTIDPAEVLVDFSDERIEAIRYKGDIALVAGGLMEAVFEGALVIAACVVLRQTR